MAYVLGKAIFLHALALRLSNRLVACGAVLLFGPALGTKYLALAFTPIALAWAYYATRNARSTALFGLGSARSFLPAALLVAFASLPLIFWWDRRIIPYGITLLAVLLGWFWSSQVFRYLTAILPLWCFLSIWSLDKAVRHGLGWALDERGAFGFDSQRVIAVTAFCAVLAAVLPPYLNVRGLVHPGDLERVVVQREQFLKRTIREYGVIQHIRRSGYEGQRIYQIESGTLLSYLRDNRVLGDWFGLLGYKHYLSKYRKDPGGLVDELREKGISLLAVRRAFLSRFPIWDEHFQTHLPIDYQDEHALLFRIPAEANVVFRRPVRGRGALAPEGSARSKGNLPSH